MREVSVNDQSFRMTEISFHADFTFGFTVAVELIQVQRAQEEWIEIDVLDGDFAVERERIGETNRDITGEFAGAHGRAEPEARGVAIGVEPAVEAADSRLA